MALEDLTTLAGESVYQNGEVVEGGDQSDNENTIRNKLNDVITELTRGAIPELDKANSFTEQQTFVNGLLTNLIQSLTTGANILLDPQGGLVYVNSVDAANELATKGYVNLTTGNIPPGGTANNWLEGTGGWTDPNARWQNQTGSFTATIGGWYKIDEGAIVTLPNPSTATEGEIILKPKIGQDLTSTAATVARFSAEQIAGDSADLTCSTNITIILTSNGTDWEVRREEIGRI